jgi:hypothetical protein
MAPPTRVHAEATMKIGWFHLMPYRFLPDETYADE